MRGGGARPGVPSLSFGWLSVLVQCGGQQRTDCPPCQLRYISKVPSFTHLSVPGPWPVFSRCRFKKGRYIEYTDDTFTTEKPG